MTFDDEEEKAAAPSEEEMRERILRERDVAEAERIKELEELSEQLDKEIEMEIRGMSPCCTPSISGIEHVVPRDDGRREDKYSSATGVLGFR